MGYGIEIRNSAGEVRISTETSDLLTRRVYTGIFNANQEATVFLGSNCNSSNCVALSWGGSDTAVDPVYIPGTQWIWTATPGDVWVDDSGYLHIAKPYDTQQGYVDFDKTYVEVFKFK